MHNMVLKYLQKQEGGTGLFYSLLNPEIPAKYWESCPKDI